MAGTLLTEIFANWTYDFYLDNVPEEVVKASRRAILDTLGVMVAGSVHPLVRKLASGLPAIKGSCSTINREFSNAETAALINGTAAHAWDFDDTSYTGIMHGSAVVLPVVLALVEECEGNETDLLSAFIVGSEITYTLADICTHDHYFSGWWSTVTFSLIGATAAAGCVLGLTDSQIRHAICLAACSASGVKAVFGSDAKPFLVGETARQAISFARAAKIGVTGPVDAFENSKGYFALLNKGVAKISEVNTLGGKWRLVSPGLLHKLNPVCSAAHAAIEQMRLLMKEADVNATDIVSITAEVPALVNTSLIYPQPVSVQQAQFSLPYALACSAIHGFVRLDDLTVDEISTEQKLRLMDKVTVIEADDLSTAKMLSLYPESTRLSVKFLDGSVLQGFCSEAYGMPGRPLSDDDLYKKFSGCVEFAGKSIFKPPVSDKYLLTLAAELFHSY